MMPLLRLFRWLMPVRGLLLLQIALSPSAYAATDNVYVEPSTPPFLNTTVKVDAGKFLPFTLDLTKGLKLTMFLSVSGGTDDQAKIWLMEQADYQNYLAGKSFQYFKNAGGTVTKAASYELLVPETGRYYLVIDNRAATHFPRNVGLYAFSILPSETDYTIKTKKMYQDLYALTRDILIFPEFKIYQKRCGFANAFSNPDITICTEFIESLAGFKAPGDTLMFTFFHELGHTLLELWEFPMADNEDAADEFAAVAMIVLDLQTSGLNAAQWFENQTSLTEAVAKLLIDDRHTISPQRARNIARWLNQGSPLLRRWQKIFVPNMQTPLLKSLHADTKDWIDHELVRGELIKRAVMEK